MSEIQFKSAARTNVRPLVCLYSESGCGKTFTALLLARGLAGPTGKIKVVDSERGRAQLYADLIPGGYETADIEMPFTPQKYTEYLEAAQASADVVVVDSFSHAWEGVGGVNHQAAESEERTGKAGLHNRNKPMMAHNLMIQALVRCQKPIICTLRAKYKWRQVKNEQNKTQIVQDEEASPIQHEGFIYEMLVHGQVMDDHSFRLTKASHPELKAIFAKREPLTIAHGEALARWCAGGATAPAAKPATVPDDRKAVMQSLWKTCLPIRGSDQSWKTALAKLIEWKIVPADKKLADLSVDQLREVLEKTQIAIDEMEPATP